METQEWPPGFRLIPEFLTPEEEQGLVEWLDGPNNQWCGRGVPPNEEMKRLTQHHGALFRFKTRKIEREWPIPREFAFILSRLAAMGIFSGSQPGCSGEACQFIAVNEYLPGRGIMHHVDSPEIFGETIAGVSLLSDCLISFRDLETKAVSKVHLPARSLMLMTGCCRYRMSHEISKLEQEVLGDLVVQRSRRISLTMRSIKAWKASA